MPHEGTIESNRAAGVILESGEIIHARAVVLTTGTFLNGLCHEGKIQTVAARHGDRAMFGLSSFLQSLGVRLRRFKTGTTPRVRLSSLNLAETLPMESEQHAGTLSFLHRFAKTDRELYGCWQTWTNENTHEIIRENLNESAMYSGQIQGVGPRYCPSIEDKIVKFADKDSHPIFLEIETWDGESVYVQGVSTSLPANVQLSLLQTVKGMEKVEIMRPGYAVEYDMADPLQLDQHLMSKLLPGLFLAGQLNGTSGYEEAAGQGMVAGINAARLAQDLEPVDFPRDRSFIGVMVDDLVTKGVEDPYRMLTARAEHRLLLRHDNADARLTPLGRQVGLVKDARWGRFQKKQDELSKNLNILKEHSVMPFDNELLVSVGTPAIDQRVSYFDLMKRPEIGLAKVEALALAKSQPLALSEDQEVREQLELAGLYDGYIQRQERLANQHRRLDGMKIPVGFDFKGLGGLSYESSEKLDLVRPGTIGQASRIPGVRPADIALLIGHLKALVSSKNYAERAPI